MTVKVESGMVSNCASHERGWWLDLARKSGLMYLQPEAVPFYMVNTFTFAAALGYLMHKTDSWIGPGLMHGASDFFLFIALLST